MGRRMQNDLKQDMSTFPRPVALLGDITFQRLFPNNVILYKDTQISNSNSKQPVDFEY